ncbi:MAG: O-antigen ligase family protein [Bacteroidetes bacterium]|nr:O-antigen ligase family protein [Bacteroidota bacterium]
MVEYLRINYQFITMLFIWVIAGVFGGVAAYGIILLTMVLLKRREMYTELFLGFFFILILSDLRSDAFDFAVDIKKIYIAMLGIFLLLDSRQFYPFNKLYLPFALFFVEILVLTIFSEIWATSIQKSISYILIFLIVPNYVMRIYRDKGKTFLKDLIYFGAIILIIGLVLFVVKNDWVVLAGRYRGLLGNPNGLGLFTILYFLSFSIVKYFYRGLFDRNDLIMIYVAIAFSVILCGSRNAVFSILIYLFFERFYSISPYLSFVIMVTIAVTNQLITANLELIVRAVGLEEFLRVETIKGASGRVIAWDFALEHIKDNLIFGKGFAYDEYLFGMNYQRLSILGHEGGVHSTYLSFALNSGVIGVILFFSGLIYKFLETIKNTQVGLAVMLTVLFSITFESWLVASLNPFTIQFIIILTLLTSGEVLSDAGVIGTRSKTEVE